MILPHLVTHELESFHAVSQSFNSKTELKMHFIDLFTMFTVEYSERVSSAVA